jgi:hypothetical protein
MPPLAVQDVASLLAQARLLVWPTVTLGGSATRPVTAAGAGLTVKDVVAVALPRGPMHNSVYE